MKVKKYLNPSSPLTKKKRRLFYFTPEQEKLFNLVTVPGTNVNSNTTVNAARKTGVEALNFLAQEAARRNAEIEARSDRKTVKRLTTVGERLRGDNGYSSYMSAGTPMSGRDPALGTIFDWTVGAKGIDAFGKTALWNYAKYVPTSGLGRWGRNYFINLAFNQQVKNSILEKQEVFPGLFGWAPKQTFEGYHASNEAEFVPNFFYRGWALRTHGAPSGIYMANGIRPSYGFLTKRPYVHQVKTTFEKPMVLLGEVSGPTKNGIRNQIEEQARSMGADGIIYKDIADNQMLHLFIAKTLNPDTKVEQLYQGAKPYLQRNYSGNTKLKGFSYNDLPQEKYVYNDKTGDFDVIAPRKEWIQKGENELVPDYFTSPEEYQRLIDSGLTPKEALDILDVRWLNSIEAYPGKLRNLGENTFGDAQNINGRAFVRYNSRKGARASLNDAITTLNTVFHELGGHGSSLNIGYGTLTIPVNMKDILMKIYEHNESLRPKLKPFYLAVKDGKFNLAKTIAEKEGIELSSLKGSSGEIDFNNLQNFIKYMEENLEYSARAIGTNMSNHYGMPNGWNETLLRDIFTKESVDNLLKNVWNAGIPLTIGGYTLNNVLQRKQGGKITINNTDI